MQEVNVPKTKYKNYQLIIFAFSLLIFLLSPFYFVSKYQFKRSVTNPIISVSPTPTYTLITPTNKVIVKDKVESPTPTSFQISYTCPPSGWVDCMPGPGKNKVECSRETQDWYNMNCPDFQGVAY